MCNFHVLKITQTSPFMPTYSFKSVNILSIRKYKEKNVTFIQKCRIELSRPLFSGTTAIRRREYTTKESGQNIRSNGQKPR